MNTPIRSQTVALVNKMIRPLIDLDLITVPEGQTIAANLRHLAENGNLMPAIPPKLVTQEEAAEILCIGLSNFKKLEKEGRFPFRRKMIGTAVRYRNTELYAFIASNDDLFAETTAGTNTDPQSVQATN